MQTKKAERVGVRQLRLCNLDPLRNLINREEQMKARFGFSIVERRDGFRLNHYANRPAKEFEVAKVRIMALCRDIRLKHLSERVFEVWDGIDPICVMTVHSDGKYFVKPYLLPVYTKKEKANRERDYFLSVKGRRNNQQTGRVAGDMTSWIKAEPKERVLCKMVDKSSWKASTKCVSRKLEK
jgi:hypothetical protein